MSAIDDVLAANERFAAAYDEGEGKAPPRKQLLVLACMDARIDPIRALGLEYGDAHILRNAGGRATPDALRSLTLSGHLLGTREIMVIHHTDCGMLAPEESAVRARLDELVGQDTSDMPIGSFSDLDASVRTDVRTVEDWPYRVPDAVVRGFVYDVASGRLREVDQ